MDAIVVYESMYGDTRAIAEAIGDGLGALAVLPVHDAQGHQGTADLLVVGGPTHAHGLATKHSRRVAAESASGRGRSHVEPGATQEPDLRTWLHDLSPAAAHHAATFDTRLKGSTWMTGSASRVIARHLRRIGIDVVASESFLVEETEGPLKPGELERARAWGAALARSLQPAREHVIVG